MSEESINGSWRSVVSYDKDLPEVPERAGREHLPPEAHLRKSADVEGGFEVAEGRRESKLLLVNKLRRAVAEWREKGYPGASVVTQRLLGYWFEEDHDLGGSSFRYYFGQREALETMAYMTEVERIRDAKALVEAFGEIFYPESVERQLGTDTIEHETAVGGRRRIRRFVPELGSQINQDLPEEDLARYAFKMATGSGKTVVMALAVVYCFFHRRWVEDSPLSDNFLIVAPNVIVYQRLQRDFASGRIFEELPMVPPEWRGAWDLSVILRGEGTEPAASGNLFVTNIQQLYEREDDGMTPANAIEALLGPKPVADLSSGGRTMLERIESLSDLVVMNDEAHHVHDKDLKWHQTLTGLHEALPTGLSLWLDFSATPKDQNGTYFPWIITDYPLAQAVEDRIVKAPLIVHRVEKESPRQVTGNNAVEAYGDWLLAALSRFRVHEETYQTFELKPVLFIMAENSAQADAIGKWLVEEDSCGLTKEEVLVIHTNREGEVNKGDLDKAREAVNTIDDPQNRIKVVVSVLMLREGWDVRNVTVVLGLRPYTASAGILPEQAIGRGLRLMTGVGPDRTQSLEVIGTPHFEAVVRELEKEGLGVKTVSNAPDPPVKIEPVANKLDKDIWIPHTTPTYRRNYTRLSEVDPAELEPLYNREELGPRSRIHLRMQFAPTETEVHETELDRRVAEHPQEPLSRITRKVERAAGLGGRFAELYPLVRGYCRDKAFGTRVELDDPAILGHLSAVEVQEQLSGYLADAVGRASAEELPLRLEHRLLKLSETPEFTWRRNLPALSSDKTIFNLVATYNDFEKDFARFLDAAPDVDRFAALATAGGDSAGGFWVNYLKPSGAIGRYYPDWVVVQSPDIAGGRETFWVIETKGRVWEGTESKDAAMQHWCEQVSQASEERWQYARVNQAAFQASPATSFGELLGIAGQLFDGTYG